MDKYPAFQRTWLGLCHFFPLNGYAFMHDGVDDLFRCFPPGPATIETAGIPIDIFVHAFCE
jgi:hypothetical protein